MDVSIIIVNYRSMGLLKQCLKNISRLQLPLTFEIIVIDNASHDQSVNMVATLFPTVHYIQLASNRGYSVGVNTGLHVAQGRYRLILNPDIAIFGHELERLVEFMDKSPNVGVVGPKLINPDGSLQYTCYNFPSFFMPFYRRTFLGQLPWVKRRLADYLMTWWDHSRNRDVDWLLGGCLLIRATALQQVGLFDERFFMYFEDVDFCRQCWQRGWRVAYFADSEIVHYHQRSSAEQWWPTAIFSQTSREHIKSWLKYFVKYIGAPLPKHLTTNHQSS